jgi:hypothetical protein
MGRGNIEARRVEFPASYSAVLSGRLVSVLKVSRQTRRSSQSPESWMRWTRPVGVGAWVAARWVVTGSSQGGEGDLPRAFQESQAVVRAI